MIDADLISESSAREIIALLVRQAGERHQLAEHLQTQTSKEAFRRYGPIIGRVTGAVYEEGMARLLKSYPHLKPEDFP